jgi:hypothetical protein
MSLMVSYVFFSISTSATLPRSEIQSTISDRDGDSGSNKGRFRMRNAFRLSGMQVMSHAELSHESSGPSAV